MRMLSKNKILLRNVLENASHSNKEADEAQSKRLRELIARRNDEQQKADKLMKIMEEHEDARIDMMVDRVNQRQESVRQLDDQILATEKAIEALRQPIEALEELFSKYRYFWDRWRKLNFDGRKKAIHTLVRVMNLFPEDDKHFKLELELITSIKTITSTNNGGGSDTKFCNLLTYGSPILYVIPTISWAVRICRINSYKNRNLIQFSVSDPILTFSPFRELFQENLHQLFVEYSYSGRKSKPIHPTVQAKDRIPEIDQQHSEN